MADTAWNDTPAPALPALTQDLTADVVVIGLGGGGLAALRALAPRSWRLVGLDAGEPGAGAGGRNGGFLLAGLASFHHDAVRTLGNSRAAAWYRRTLAECDRLVAAWPALARRVGSLRIADDEIEFEDCASQLEAMWADELPVNPYVGAEGRGLLFPSDAAFQPYALCQAEAAELRGRGVALFGRSPVLKVEPDRVHTGQGSVRAGQVIVAVDGGLERLLPELSPWVRTARLQMLATSPQPQVELPRPVYCRHGYDYWQQLPDRSIALGGARDRGGEEEWTHVAETSDRVQAALDELLRDRLGVDPAAVVRRWAANVAYHDELLPLCRRLPSGVIALGAYNGTGNLLSRCLGAVAADIAAERRLPDWFVAE